MYNEEFKECHNNWSLLHIGRTFSQITWFPYPVKPMGWWITLSLYRYQVLSVHSALAMPLGANCVALNLCVNVLRNHCTHPSIDKYFSTQHRPFSTPAPVQRYMDTFMPKSKAESPGRSFTLCCGGRVCMSPTRELPKWVKQIDSSTKSCNNPNTITSWYTAYN